MQHGNKILKKGGMTGNFKPVCLHLFVCILLAIFFSACDNSAISDIGSIDFSIEWQDVPIIDGALVSNQSDASWSFPRSAYAASIDCAAASVDRVQLLIYNSSGTQIASGSWPCYYHKGTVQKVPVGSDLKVVAVGRQNSDTGPILYRGEVGSITVTGGQTTEAGAIPVYSFVPELSSPSEGGLFLNSFQWQSVTGADKYRLIVSKNSDLSNPIMDTRVSGTSYSGGALDDATYYWSLSALDAEGNEGSPAAYRRFQVSASSSDTFTNSLGMTFVKIPAGMFMMGSPENEPGRESNETLHQVTLTQDFYMQTTEVTQGHWQAVMGNNPSYFQNCGTDCPVEQVSWNETQDFITALNKREEGAYRLPTEAEWEYAARAGSDTAFANGDLTNKICLPVDPNLDEMGWYCGNSCVTYEGGYECPVIISLCSSCGSHSAAQKQPNSWGLYDMHGNVKEWCLDWYGDYSSSSTVNPQGPSSGNRRVLRGGSWVLNAWNLRSAYRNSLDPDYQGASTGFRLVVVLPDNKR